jgi:hypothetical protein
MEFELSRSDLEAALENAERNPGSLPGLWGVVFNRTIHRRRDLAYVVQEDFAKLLGG